MKRNILHAIRWAIFIPCALAVSLTTSIVLTYAEELLVHTLTSGPVNLLSHGHLIFKILLSLLCVFIYFFIGNKITPPNHKRLGNAVLFMAFITLEIGFVLTTTFTVCSDFHVDFVTMELINNIVALIASIGIFAYYHQVLHSIPHKKRHLRNPKL